VVTAVEVSPDIECRGKRGRPRSAPASNRSSSDRHPRGACDDPWRCSCPEIVWLTTLASREGEANGPSDGSLEPLRHQAAEGSAPFFQDATRVA
jgi:hypothetical protein